MRIFYKIPRLPERSYKFVWYIIKVLFFLYNTIESSLVKTLYNKSILSIIWIPLLNSTAVG